MIASAYLFDMVRDRLHTYETFHLDPVPDEPYCGADVWLLASLLQKAVRRGDLQTARKSGAALLKLDAPRLWRRLMTLAIEDIGIADVAAAAEIVAISVSSQVRKLLGRQALDIALVLACKALKDRSGDHMASLLRVGQSDAALEQASKNALLAVIASQHQPWGRRLQAVQLAGQRMRHENQELFDFFAEIGVPQPLVAAGQIYHRRGRDGLALYVCLAWSFWQGRRSQERLLTPPRVDWIGAIPGYAFDPLHTRLGQRAVELWLRSYLSKAPFSARQVAIALWNLESAFCNRLLAWPLGKEIAAAANAADLVARYVPEERHAALQDWVEKERAVLHCARVAVWQSEQRTRRHRCEQDLFGSTQTQGPVLPCLAMGE